MDPNVAPQPQVQAQPAAPQVQAMPAAAPAPAMGAAQTTVSPAKKSNKKMIIVLLLMLVVVAVIAVVAYMFVSNNTTSTVNKQTYVAPQKQTVSPTPTPDMTVANSTQLDSAINEVNNTSTSTIESEFTQAATEAKSL